MDFHNHSPRIGKCENHGFSQGFAMSTLLMHTGSQNATRRAKEKVTARNYYVSSRGVETKHNCTGKRTMGSLARAGSEARPGSERRRPAAGRRPVPSTGQNTILPAHSGLRPLFTTVTEERICSERIPGHTTRAPPAGFELETNGFQFYALANLDKT